jgi:succinate dehydrogenase / fumarate reductase, membrane anchor subunit
MSVYVLQGLKPWLVQRISAVYILLFVVYVGIAIACAGPAGYDAWRGWLFAPANRIATGLFVIALLLHAWVGMRDVILDYVHNTVVRIFALSLVLAVLFGSGFWCAKVLLLELIP